MKKTSLCNNPLFDQGPVSTDGRRKRSDRSRQKIIAALFELLREGDMTPSAVAVAAKADVGLRTVFRHFEDMDSIYIEMTDEVMNAVMPKVLAPFKATNWRERLIECVDKRADLYETVFPVKVCMSLRRFQSPFLKQQYDRDISLMRSSLKAILPTEVIENKPLFEGLEVALAFSTWRRLRQDQGLSIEEAKATQLEMLTGLTASLASVD